MTPATAEMNWIIGIGIAYYLMLFAIFVKNVWDNKIMIDKKFVQEIEIKNG